MGSYLEEHLYYFSPIFAAIAFLTSLTIFRGKENPRYLKAFSLFLLVNLITDTISAIQDAKVINNLLFVNLVTVFDVSFYCYFIREIVRSKAVKKILLYCLIIYPAVFLVNTLLIQGSVVFHSMTYALGCLLIVLSCVYYFWELFQQPDSVNLSRQPAFWISSGLLFYYACTFPFYGTTNLVRALPKVILKNLLLIFVLLNILQYLSFTIAFLCRLRTRKSMSSY
ncbi:MAG TPA: hypothetical protein VGS79_07705 [Puia sp.]|nr:hypothetical protein [Puia sp.]